MKKVILTTIIALVTVVGAFAQSTADVAVTAEVNSAITLTPTNVAFGTIEQSEASYLLANEDDTGTSENIGADAAAGSLVIAGANAEVQVAWTSGTLSDGEATPTTATFTPSVWLGDTEVTSEGTVNITGGSITLDIGGGLTAIGTAGSYSTATGGTPVTFTVSYTDV